MENYEVHRDRVRQNRLSILPGFVAKFQREGARDSFKLINIGKGVALSVRLVAIGLMMGNVTDDFPGLGYVSPEEYERKFTESQAKFLTTKNRKG